VDHQGWYKTMLQLLLLISDGLLLKPHGSAALLTTTHSSL
jgi:hypothetical protein